MLNKTINIGFITKLLTLLPDKDNSVISPYGITAVLAMAAEGASGNSLNEILTYLGFDTVDELRGAVVDAIKNPCDAFSSENVVTLRKGGDGAKLCDQFKHVMACQYAADVEEKDAAGESTVELSNIATFKAKWLMEMERDITAKKCFHNADGTLCHPAFLSCTEELRCYQDDEFWPTVKAVAIPYALAGHSIPYELVLVDSEKPLTESLINEMLSNMQQDECEVEFPEFSIKSNYDLIPMMKILGIRDIFNQEKSALDSIASEPLYAESFGQKAEIQVDKNGTVAIAITCMTLCLMEDYLHDVDICQKFAERNRAKMAQIILDRCGWTALEAFQTIHNYIDVNEMVLRKGAVSAKAGEKLLVPINMRDGSLICLGKGNEDWNFSAPHGAGRLMSRSAAFERLTMAEYEAQMAGIYSTCVVPDTLDESPMAYKSMEEIVENIEPTADILCRIKPIYNFKAAE